MRKRQLRETAPVSDRGIPPPFGFDVLALKTRRDSPVTVGIDERGEQLPLPLHGSEAAYTPIIMLDEFVKEACAG